MTEAYERGDEDEQPGHSESETLSGRRWAGSGRSESVGREHVVSDSRWMEVRQPSDVFAVWGIECPRVVNRDRVLRAMMKTPELRHLLRAEESDRQVPQGRPTIWVRGTRFWVDVTGLRRVRDDIAWAGVVDALTLSLTVSAVATVVRQIAERVQVLTEDEAELVTIIISLSKGDPYRRPVDESEIRAAYQDALVSVDDLLQALVDKGVVIARRSGWVQLRF